MEKPVLSPDFMIEDIYKIREWKYERTKDMTVAEKAAYYNSSSKEYNIWQSIDVQKIVRYNISTENCTYD